MLVKKLLLKTNIQKTILILPNFVKYEINYLDQLTKLQEIEHFDSGVIVQKLNYSLTILFQTLPQFCLCLVFKPAKQVYVNENNFSRVVDTRLD